MSLTKNSAILVTFESSHNERIRVSECEPKHSLLYKELTAWEPATATWLHCLAARAARVKEACHQLHFSLSMYSRGALLPLAEHQHSICTGQDYLPQEDWTAAPRVSQSVTAPSQMLTVVSGSLLTNTLATLASRSLLEPNCEPHRCCHLSGEPY